MPWRPVNDIILLEMEPIVRYEGLIAIPDKNSEEKISPYGTIVSWGSRCHYKYQVGQRVMIDRFFDKPQYLETEGKKYRMVKEHYLHAVFE